MAVTSYPVITGAADDEDANLNPTPNTTSFPAANYSEGAIFKPSSYLTTFASGDTLEGAGMTFQIQSGAWVWIDGSYRASNSNGEYKRSADGAQVCEKLVTVAFGSTNALSASWTFPKAFLTASTPRVRTSWFGTATGFTPPANDICYVRGHTLSVSSVTVELGRQTGGTNFVTGDTATVDSQATGKWK